MARISVAATHHMSHAKAKTAAERLAQDLEQRFGLRWHWTGDDCRFERPGVAGTMHVGRTEIRLDVQLGFFLSPLKPMIEREIHAQLDRLAGSESA